VDDTGEYENHSPGTTALTPPVSPSYTLQQSSKNVSLYYSEQQATEEILDFYAYEKEPASVSMQPSQETIDDLVSEHFRNCGVNPSSSSATTYNQGFADHEHFAFGHAARYPVMQQVRD
jgi:hypothetical protein